MRKHWWKGALLGALLLSIPMGMAGYTMMMDCNKVKAAEVESEAQGAYGVLTWTQNLNAVRYEVEVFAGVPKDLTPDAAISQAVYRNAYVYTHRVILDMTKLPTDKPLFWRVRAFDLDGNG